MPKKSDYEQVYRQIITLLANVLADPQPANDKVIRLSSMNRKHPSKINSQSNKNTIPLGEKCCKNLSKEALTDDPSFFVKNENID